VASVDGKQICLASSTAEIKTVADAEALGLAVAQDLISQGASALLP
jgi:hydroxymethylbilane synthase